MASRRQEKVVRIIKQEVSSIISNQLSDPRIKSFISITEVDVSPNLQRADIYLSIMDDNDGIRRRTLEAIEHAAGRIQMLLGRVMTSKFCPHLYFHEDQKLKKTLETLRIIQEATRELDEKDGKITNDE
jgi:ribosome-binding factor A